MTEEKSHEHHEHNEHKHHEHHSHKKKDESYKFEITKVRVWQGVSLVLAIAVVFLWFGQGPSAIPGAQQFQAPPQQAPPQPGLPPPPTQVLDIDEDDDPTMGKQNAPVTIVAFEDYQCPFCQRAHTQTFPQLKKEYIDTGKVKYVYRDFPLSFHPEAQPAAEASECADEQGRFWDYHDKLYENQGELSTSLYLKLAEDLGLDTDQFKQCIDTGKYRQEVQNDFSYGSSVGVSGTPTFFINGIKLVGAQPFQAFKQVIDAELAK